MKTLEDLIAVVTGASRGIGAATASMLVDEGATVVLAARSRDKLEALSRRIEQDGGRALAMTVDMADEDSIKALVQRISAEFGRIDILVNNAGVVHSHLLKDTSTQAWDECMNVNARGPFLLCRETLNLLEASKRAFIINIGSVVSIKAYAKQAAYTASKHALRGMTQALAEELQGTNISVHMICPGGVDTVMLGDVRPDIPKNELMYPEEIADIVRFIVTRSGRGLLDEFRIRRATSSPWF